MVPCRREKGQDPLTNCEHGKRGEGARRMRREEEEGCRGHEGAERLSQGKNRRKQEWRYHNRGRHFRFTEKSGTREMSGDLQR